jgi:hypothetical protein
MKTMILTIKTAPCMALCCSAKQRGAVLFIGLILLMGITILSLSGMQSVVINQRLASNSFELDREKHLNESASIIALQNNAKINQTLHYLETDSLGGYGPNPVVEVVITELPPDPITVGLIAKKIPCNGCSSGLDSGFVSILLETHGQVGSSNSKGILVQGYQIIGANK